MPELLGGGAADSATQACSRDCLPSENQQPAPRSNQLAAAARWTAHSEDRAKRTAINRGEEPGGPRSPEQDREGIDRPRERRGHEGRHVV